MEADVVIVGGGPAGLACALRLSQLIDDGNRVVGLRTDDKGVDKRGQQKSNFEPGYDLRSKIAVLGEGPRGSLTKQLASRFNIHRDSNPQVYGVGVKELWELPPG